MTAQDAEQARPAALGHGLGLVPSITGNSRKGPARARCRKELDLQRVLLVVPHPGQPKAGRLPEMALEIGEQALLHRDWAQEEWRTPHAPSSAPRPDKADEEVRRPQQHEGAEAFD